MKTKRIEDKYVINHKAPTLEGSVGLTTADIKSAWLMMRATIHPTDTWTPSQIVDYLSKNYPSPQAIVIGSHFLEKVELYRLNPLTRKIVSWLLKK